MDENATEQIARRYQVRVADPVADRSAVSLRLDNARCPEGRKVLGRRGLGQAKRIGEVSDLRWSGRERVNEAQARPAGDRAQDARLDLV
jgi:hypothetical protein